MRVQLQIPITLDFIKQTLKPLKTSYKENALISHVCTDSRTACKGDLYIPLNGEKYSGEDFLTDAAKSGAYTLSARSDSCDIKVKDTSLALLDLASAYKDLFSLKETVAITGSVGKSTTKNLTREILSAKYRVHATDGNLNNEIGVPFTVFSMPADTEILIVEAGMNHFDELHRISLCIHPSLCVITKIGTSHIGNLKSRAGIAKAKAEIFDGMSVIKGIIPYNEPLLYGFSNTKTVSLAFPDADFYLSVSEQSSSSLKSKIILDSSLFLPLTVILAIVLSSFLYSVLL
jgi:UDP-N-acetylmuramoyl-tripeptide--D-alanyl-D-alanine ligase